MSRAVVISGGSIADYNFTSKLVSSDDFIICADSGIVHCQKMNLKADLLVGDFDSCDFGEWLKCDAANGAEFERLVPEKDDTDTEYALFCAAKRGFDEILLLGGCGTRADHSLANICLLEQMHNLGVHMQIVNEKNRIRILKNGQMRLEKDYYKYVSVIPLDRTAEGVTCTGFKYPLNNDTLNRFSSRGISNELVCQSGVFSVKNGTLLVIESID